MIANPDLAARLRGNPALIAHVLRQLPERHLVEAEVMRRNFHRFMRGAWSVLEPAREFIDNWHIGNLAEHLEACARREIKFLVVNVPPGAMKSLTVNVMFPAWDWTNHPEDRFFCLGAADDLPTRDSLKCRRLIESDWYQMRWGTKFQLTSDQNAKTKYENDKSGVRSIGSFAGTILGERADFIPIDDPHKTDLAESDDVREGKLIKFREEVYTRRADERSVIIIIMQRLHERDLAGWALAEGLADAHVCIPMRFEERRKVWVLPREVRAENADPRTRADELMDPKRFPETEVSKLETVLGAFAAAGQLQQRPTPRGGGIVKREDFRFYRQAEPWKILRELSTGNYEVMRELANAHSWDGFDFHALSTDAAFKDNDTSSFVVIQAWARKSVFNYLRGQRRDRMSFTKTLTELRAMREDFPNANATLVEDKANGPAIIDVMKDEVPGLIAIEPIGSKPARAEAAAPLITAHNVVLPIPEEAGYVEGFISEWLSVPKGAFWDQVDASDQYLLKYGRSVTVKLSGAAVVAESSVAEEFA